MANQKKKAGKAKPGKGSGKKPNPQVGVWARPPHWGWGIRHGQNTAIAVNDCPLNTVVFQNMVAAVAFAVVMHFIAVC
jgi:hypothetical protein